MRLRTLEKNPVCLGKLLFHRGFIVTFSFTYGALLVYLLFFAFFREDTTTVVNLIPFRTIISLTVHHTRANEDWWHWWLNIAGNVLAFVPLAVPFFYLQLKKISRRLVKTLIIALPCFIELMQLVFQTGSADIDDVILNSTGIFLGLWLIKKYVRQPVG